MYICKYMIYVYVNMIHAQGAAKPWADSTTASARGCQPARRALCCQAELSGVCRARPSSGLL